MKLNLRCQIFSTCFAMLALGLSAKALAADQYQAVIQSGWTNPKLTGKIARVITSDHRTIVGPITSTPQVTYDARGEANVPSPLVINGQTVQFSQILSFETQVTAEQQAQAAAFNPDHWTQVEPTNPALVGHQVRVIFRDSFGGTQNGVGVVQSPVRKSFDARGEENVPEPLVLADGKKIPASNILLLFVNPN